MLLTVVTGLDLLNLAHQRNESHEDVGEGHTLVVQVSVVVAVTVAPTIRMFVNVTSVTIGVVIGVVAVAS